MRKLIMTTAVILASSFCYAGNDARIKELQEQNVRIQQKANELNEALRQLNQVFIGNSAIIRELSKVEPKKKAKKKKKNKFKKKAKK